MNEHPLFSKMWIMITVVVAIILGVAVLGMIVMTDDEAVERPGDETTGDTVDTSDWQTYTSDEFGFSIKHPADWTVATHTPQEGENRMIVPAVNIYPESATATPPFDHHYDDVANLSIFPEGVPTEGVSGDQVSSDVAFDTNVVEPVDYVLEDGSPWATLVRFDDAPESWEDWGFVWARADIADLEVTCLSGGESVTMDQCDPLTGDRIIRSGKVDSTERKIQEAMLRSFEFESE